MRDDRIELAAEYISKALKAGHVLYAFGNGGSAAQASHLCAEFVGHEPPLAAIALTTDTSALTAIGNDYGFEQVFERQVKALCKKGDVVIGMSTSGKSVNVIRGTTMAARMGAFTIALTGWQSSPLKKVATLVISAHSTKIHEIQDEHSRTCHLLFKLATK